MNDFTIKKATRQGVKPLIGLYGKSGSGKTYTALLLARGIAGPTGKIRLIDSESGRGSIFADMVPGGYEVIDLNPPFSPDAYSEAVHVAEQGADVVVVDSLSHCWSGEGGVLDMQEDELYRMAKDDYGKREACKMAAWIKPKFAFKKFTQRLLRCRCALICCLRGEEKTHMVKDGGKNRVTTDEFSSPLYDQRFIFELLINFETIAKDGKGGYVIPRKITHPQIGALLPGPNEQIGVKHGEAITKWCSAPGGPPAAQASTGLPELKKLKKELWDLTTKQHGGNPLSLNQWLWDEGLQQDTESIEEMGIQGMLELLDKVRAKLK